jgi:hypothetical protein
MNALCWLRVAVGAFTRSIGGEKKPRCGIAPGRKLDLLWLSNVGLILVNLSYRVAICVMDR